MRMTRSSAGTRFMARIAFAVSCVLACAIAAAGEQKYEPLSASVQAGLHRSVADHASPRLTFASQAEGAAWLADMSRRLEKHLPDRITPEGFPVSVQYQANRAGPH